MTITGTGKAAGAEGNGVERMDKPASERTRAVDAAILAIEKQFGRGSIMKLGLLSIPVFSLAETSTEGISPPIDSTKISTFESSLFIFS